MTRSIWGRQLRWLAAAAVILLLTALPATGSAQEEEEGECAEASTPNLVITAVNAGKDGPRLTLTVFTDKTQTGPYVDGHWNVIYRGSAGTLDSYEIHRVMLRGHEGEEPVAATANEGCSSDEDDCGGEDEAGMTGAGIRGIGYVNGVKMRFQIDLKDYGNNPVKPDMARVRWRVYTEGDSGHEDSGDCIDQGWTNNFWFPVQQINIHLR